jgi:hypothetical protein
MRIWGSQRSQYQLFHQFLLRLVLLFVCSPILALFRRRVPRFPLDLRHLLQIVVLTQYTLAIPSGSHEKPHEHGRTP